MSVESKIKNQPKWLNAEYFREIINESHPDYELTNFIIAPVVNKGDNYMSILNRINLEITNIKNKKIEEIPIIIKYFPIKEGFQVEISKLFNVFPKEIHLYNHLLREFEKIVYENNLCENTKRVFSAKCLKISKYPNPNDVIVLEDLNQFNYKMADRQNGLDMEHCKVFLKKLGLFHATSMIYYEKNGPYHKDLLEGIFSIDPTKFENYSDNSIKSLLNYLRNWDFAKPFIKKMDQWDIKDYYKYISKISKAQDNGINVLNHGDLWTNNMLFKYDENKKVKDVLLVDYQLCFWSSPALDLNYFIVTSVSHKNKLDNIDEIISIYHKSLSENLKKMNYTKKIPSLIDIHMEMLRTGFFGVMISLRILPILLIDSHEDASIDMLMSGSDEAKKFKSMMYSNPIFKGVMEKLLPYFDRKGFLNIGDNLD